MQTPAIWVMRAGKRGEGHELFVTAGLVALADNQFGDLRKLPASRGAFGERYALHNPDATSTSIAGVSGQFFRFVFEMKVGDLVLYPAKGEKAVRIGKLIGEYDYNKAHGPEFPHRRQVEWRGVLELNKLTTPARYELGAPKTLFLVKNHLDEVSRLLNAYR